MTASLGNNAGIPPYRNKAYDSAAVSAATGHAAGVLFVAPDGDVLLLRRSPAEENFAGHWSLPGGGVDEGETPEVGALRECSEEMGLTLDQDVAGLRDLHKVTTPTGKVFHTFAVAVPKKFAPRLNDEHTGFMWASAGMLPQPMHPAVDSLLRDRAGFPEQAADGKSDDFVKWRNGFWSWLSDPQTEAMFYEGPEAAADSAILIAMDRDTVRRKTVEGRLVIERTPITKANVCPYRGSEIPKWRELGLDKDRIYNLLRDPEELRKAAPSLNGLQVLIIHSPVSAKDHKPLETVGHLGTDAEAADEDGSLKLFNSMFINAQGAIDGIEDNSRREISAGYRYRADMTPGIFNGKAFDGVMRDIVFNHVALVEDGRAGPDILAADEALREHEDMSKPVRFAAAILAATAAQLAPVLAMDSKLTLKPDLFRGLTPATFKDQRAALLAGVRSALTGVKLRPGMALDASMEGLAKAIDAFENLEAPMEGDDDLTAELTGAPPTAPDVPGTTNGTFDSAPIATFLRGKGMGEDDVKAVCDMLPKMAGDAEESEEDKKKKAEEAEKAKQAADAEAEKEKEKDKQAMDQKMKTAVGDAIKSERTNQQAIRAAIAEVKPYIGEIAPSMAFDSAADVRRHALKVLKVADADTMHADALSSVLASKKKLDDRSPPSAEPSLAMDSKLVDRAKAIAPGIANISQA